MKQITGLVLTYNGARHLAACLDSLHFCDELLVVDSNSTDSSCEIATAAGARVLTRAWEGPGPQFAFAFEQIRTPWIFSLDQDEIASELLIQSVRTALTTAPDTLAGYYCPRRSFYFDRFLKHSGWYPDRLLRLFRNGRMQVKVSGPHYSFHPLGPTEKLSGDIIHYPYANLGEHLDKINYYTAVAAKELREKGYTGGLPTALGHGLARFIKIYLLRRGFLDGKAGLILAVHGFLYAFLKYIRATELSHQNSPDTV